jgi:hypothetical protein
VYELRALQWNDGSQEGSDALRAASMAYVMLAAMRARSFAPEVVDAADVGGALEVLTAVR